MRLALPSEAQAIAAIQRRAWLGSPTARALAESVDLETATQAWWQAIARPPMAHFRVLVAVQPTGSGRDQVVCGFAAFGPSDDPDAEPDDLLVVEFCLDEAGRGLGHDDRLLNALADTARADGYRRVTWWIASTDDRLRGWLQDAGWAPDGAHREVGTDEDADLPVVRLKQVRLHTDVSAS